MKRNAKTVLDVCCGSRMFWFDRQDPRVLFVDNRREQWDVADVSMKAGRRTIGVNPDVVADFRNLPFASQSFGLVVFDPPHLKNNGARGWQARKYGKLTPHWRDDLARGFAECFRVLRREGVLVFKWNEHEIPVSEVLSLTPEQPLFGNRNGKLNKSHWIVFLKREGSGRLDGAEGRGG